MKKLFVLLPLLTAFIVAFKYTQSETSSPKLTPIPPNHSVEWHEGCAAAELHRERVKKCLVAYDNFERANDNLINTNTKKVRYGYLICRDGTVSPTCGCGGGRGCCSWHGGIGGCETYEQTHHYINGEEASYPELLAWAVEKNKSAYDEECPDNTLPWQIRHPQYTGDSWNEARLLNFGPGYSRDRGSHIKELPNIWPGNERYADYMVQNPLTNTAFSPEWITGWRKCLK